MCLPLSAMEMQINLMEKKLVTWNSSRSQLPSEYSMWISIKKFILKKCVSVGKVRVINHCNTYHCNTYHCNTYHCITYHSNTYHCNTYHCNTYHCNTYHCITYHCITYHCNTKGEPELRRGKIDESFFFLTSSESRQEVNVYKNVLQSTETIRDLNFTLNSLDSKFHSTSLASWENYNNQLFTCHLWFYLILGDVFSWGSCGKFDIFIVTENFKFFAKTLFYRFILWNYWSIHVIFDKRKMCFIAKKNNLGAIAFLNLAEA